MLILIWPEAAISCTKPYMFMAEKRSEGKVSQVEKLMNGACESAEHESLQFIQWDELAQKIFWPIRALDSEMGASFVITDKDMPAVDVLFQIRKQRNKSIQEQKCKEYEISIIGKHRQSPDDHFRSLIKGINLQGLGKAFICDDRSFPDEFFIKLKRIVEPALWSKIDHEIEDMIEVAWALIP
ncbi:MAG: hypothetical protein ABH871_06165 [Pseudomonadota bacterium]